MYEVSSSIKDIRTESNIKSQQECALLADKTEGGLLWVYERDRQECHVKPSDESRGVKSQSVAGYRGCGQLTQKEWDGMMSSDCKRAYSTNSPGEDITFKKVESQQSCAELTVKLWVGFSVPSTRVLASVKSKVLMRGRLLLHTFWLGIESVA